MWSTIKFAWQFPGLEWMMLKLLYEESPLAMNWGGRAEIQPKHLSCFQKHKKGKLYCFDCIQFYMLVIERR